MSLGYFYPGARLRAISCKMFPILNWTWLLSLFFSGVYSLIFKSVMVAQADHHLGQSPNLKMFNLVYVVGISGILLVWNMIFLAMEIHSEEPFPFVRVCMEKQSSVLPKAPVMFQITLFLTLLGIVYVYLVNRKTHRHLDRITDDDMEQLPAKNLLTYHDTKVLVLVIFLGWLIFASGDITPIPTMISVSFLLNFVFCDLLISFVHPIIIILKTKKYLPDLWSEVEILNENNDFFASYKTEKNEITVRRTEDETDPSEPRENWPSHPFSVISPDY